MIAYGVHQSGRREVLDLDVGEIESGAFWVEFLRSLRARGLAGVQLCASDAHEGLKAAIAGVPACPWQPCTVHFVRDMHQHCRPTQPGMVSAALREVFNAESYAEARERAAWCSSACARASPRWPSSRGRRGGPAHLLPLPGSALVEAPLDQPARARQPRGRPAV